MTSSLNTVSRESPQTPLKFARNGYQEKRQSPRGVCLGDAKLSCRSQHRPYGDGGGGGRDGVSSSRLRCAKAVCFRSNHRRDTPGPPLRRRHRRARLSFRFYGAGVGCLRDYPLRRSHHRRVFSRSISSDALSRALDSSRRAFRSCPAY